MLNNITTIILLSIVCCISAYTLVSIEMVVHDQIIAATTFVLSKVAIGYKFIKN